ncbi:hypothetical protein [Pectobacterium brasiliense]
MVAGQTVQFNGETVNVTE